MCVCVRWGILTDCIFDVKLAIQQQGSKDFFASSDITMVSMNGEVLYLQHETDSGSIDSSSTTEHVSSASLDIVGEKTGKNFLRNYILLHTLVMVDNIFP